MNQTNPCVIILQALTDAQIQEFTLRQTHLHIGLQLALTPQQLQQCQLQLSFLRERRQKINAEQQLGSVKPSLSTIKTVENRILQIKAEQMIQQPGCFSRFLPSLKSLGSILLKPRRNKLQNKAYSQFEVQLDQQSKFFLPYEKQKEYKSYKTKRTEEKKDQ